MSLLDLKRPAPRRSIRRMVSGAEYRVETVLYVLMVAGVLKLESSEAVFGGQKGSSMLITH